MRITFDDGEVQECRPDDTREVSIAQIVMHPASGRIPRHLKRVSDNPPTYAKLASVRCSAIAAGQHVMTAQGLKRVKSVEP
jgi:hypothetical protein